MKRIYAGVTLLSLLLVGLLIGTQNPSSAAAGPALTPTQTTAYVTALYRKILGRDPDAPGLTLYSNSLTNGTASPYDVSLALTTSPESRLEILTSLYLTLLGRTPDAPGLASWDAQVRSGTPIETVAVAFLASPEFFTRTGGTDATWLSSLYTVELGRPIDPAGQTGWTAVVLASGRLAAARGIYDSAEGQAARIAADYLLLLGRTPDPLAAGWLPVLRNQGSLVLIARLTSSTEFIQRAISPV